MSVIGKGEWWQVGEVLYVLFRFEKSPGPGQIDTQPQLGGDLKMQDQ